MIELLFIVIVLGVVAWGLTRLAMTEPFQTVAMCILILALVFAVFGYLGYGPGIKIF